MEQPPRRARRVVASRRGALAGGVAVGLGVAASIVVREARAPSADDVAGPPRPSQPSQPVPTTPRPTDGPRPLTTRPPLLVDPIVVDLTLFDPSSPIPGWDGSRPSQRTIAAFPPDRDLQVLGHRTSAWAGGGFVRGGRNVHWVGGAYTRGPWLRNFMGDGCVEGTLTRAPFVPGGRETGDGVSLLPDAKTLGRSAISILNCRTENIDGLVDAGHGDCFQLPSSYEPPGGYSSTPRQVTIERFTGTTGYQGLFLANQHFDDRGYQISCQLVRLVEVNLRKTRPQAMRTRGVPQRGHVRLLYLNDMSDQARGDRPYPVQMIDVHLEPWADEGLPECIFPDSDAGASPYTGTSLAPVVAADGGSATFPPELLVEGSVALGAPPAGDFAVRADHRGRGGLDVPGMGYISPGYSAVSN